VPSRSYATAGGVRYYELMRPSDDGLDKVGLAPVKRFKDYIRDEFKNIAGVEK
jgi:hypothetical protein